MEGCVIPLLALCARYICGIRSPQLLDMLENRNERILRHYRYKYPAMLGILWPGHCILDGIPGIYASFEICGSLSHSFVCHSDVRVCHVGMDKDLFGSRSSLLLGVNGKEGKKEVPLIFIHEQTPLRTRESWSARKIFVVARCTLSSRAPS